VHAAGRTQAPKGRRPKRTTLAEKLAMNAEQNAKNAKAMPIPPSEQMPQVYNYLSCLD